MEKKKEIVLSVKDLVTSFRTDGISARAVDDVSLHIGRGEIIGLVGESGSGKSVTSLSITQLITPPGHIDAGDIRVDGFEQNMLLYGAKSDEVRTMRGGKISMIFQEPMTSLNPVLTIGYQIQETISLHLKLDKKEAKERAIEMMRLVGIADPESRFNQYPQHFSGGMRQRIMIAMALAAEPEVLIADEATTALDVTTQAQILELLKDLAVNKGFSIIIITHNLGLVARYADRIYVMYGGNIVESAETCELFEYPTHPYTRGLLNAVPRLDDRKDRKLTPIEGLPPVPADRKPYCQFYPRCPYRENRCKERMCELKETREGHAVRCMLSLEELNQKRGEVEKTPVNTNQKQISDEICLEIRDLKMFFPIVRGLMKHKIGEVKAVNNVSFQVRKGETLGIVGESGCGKSTLARCIMRAYKPTSGEIIFNGKNIAEMKEKELRPMRSQMAMVFQDPFSSLDPRQTVGSIIADAVTVSGQTNGKKERDDRVDELFRTVGLDPALKDRVPREFSGGQRQRVGVARALASNPDLIVCDEPVSALDVSIQAQVINLLEDLQAQMGITYLFIAHDLSVVKHISDRIVVMYLGNIVEIADCERLYEQPLHPYTKALLSAVPIADPKADAARERIRLLGEVPSVLNRPAGCPFCNRCSYATERCFTEEPQLEAVDASRSVACFHYKEHK